MKKIISVFVFVAMFTGFIGIHAFGEQQVLES